MPWTDGVDRATGYLITAVNWNDLVGANGSLMFLKGHAHTGAAGDGSGTIVPVTIGNNGSIAWNGRVLLDKGIDIASAATLTPGTDGNYFHITGTTGITAIASLQAGTIVVFEFDGALTITHNATSLILQGAANLTTAAGDVVAFVSEGAGNWRELFRRLAAVPASGALTRVGGNLTEATTTSTTAVDLLSVSTLSIPATTPFIYLGIARKTAGALADTSVGLKINTTVVGEAIANATGSQGVWNNSNLGANEVEYGGFMGGFGSRVTNYLRPQILGYKNTLIGSGSSGSNAVSSILTADLPTATITDIVFRGKSDSASVTLGVDEVHIYTFAVS